MPDSSRRGFTLAEVLLASVILAFGLVAVSRAMLKAYEAFGHSARMSQASRLLEQTMDGMMLASASTSEEWKPDQAYATQGRFDPPNQSYSWTFEARTSGLYERMREAETRVLWSDHGNVRSISAWSYVETPEAAAAPS